MTLFILALLATFHVGQSLVVDSFTARQTGKNLTILPLGDSITFGVGSSDGNGYRNDLHGLLDFCSHTVNMVGSIKSGTMVDNDNEGHSGFTISQIATNAGVTSSLALHPNVVLLHIGTNDMNLNSDVGNAPARLGSLIDQIFTASPDAVLFVAQIIMSTSSTTQSRIVAYNAAIPAVLAVRQLAGKKVLVVNMGNLLTAGDMADALHPNDQGYVMMANAWSTALQNASHLGIF
ncbi:SGNH hydrolase [Hymenopellis radicata]|nr:SGNH hydrolase [Hymenopellis radicata]